MAPYLMAFNSIYSFDSILLVLCLEISVEGAIQIKYFLFAAEMTEAIHMGSLAGSF